MSDKPDIVKDHPNSDTMGKPINPYGPACPAPHLPLAKPPKESIAERERKRLAKLHPELVDSNGNLPKPGFYENGFVPKPDMAEIERLRKHAEDTAKAAREKAEADAHLGKKHEKRPVVNPDNWTHNQSKLNGFYGNLDATFKHYQVPNKEKSTCIHKALEVNSIHETTLPPLEAEIKVKAFIERNFMATKKLTQEDWVAWCSEHHWKAADVLAVLSNTNEARGLGKVTGLGQWPSLETAEKIMLDHLASTNGGNGSHEQDEPPAEQPAQPKNPTPPPPSRAGTGSNPFRPAVFTDSKLRMALVGPSGSGKTYTGLNIACNMIPNGKVAVIDTERGSAKKYAKYFTFDVTELRSYHPDSYIKAINDAVAYKYDVLMIDSLSQAWEGEKGILSMVKDGGGGFDKWKDANPVLWKLINTILDSPIHIITTMRVKTDYVMQDYTDNRTGQIKQKPVKVGLAPRMKDGIEYEFDVYAEIDLDNTMTVTKSRYLELSATSYPRAGKEVADALNKALTA